MSFATLNRIVGSDMVAARFILSMGAMLWALFLFWPGQLFPTAAQIADGQGRTTYALMAQIAPEILWALCFAAHGSFLAVSIFFRVPPAAALLDAFNGAVLWSAATTACYLAHFHGWATYQPPAAMGADAAMVIASWWWFVRVWADKNYEAQN